MPKQKQSPECIFCRPGGRSVRLSPCGNGDFELTAGVHHKAIVIYKLPPPDKIGQAALGHFEINFCPLCGKQIREKE